MIAVTLCQSGCVDSAAHPRITSTQQGILAKWLGSWTIVADHSWPLQDTIVLRAKSGDGIEVIIKASATSHHIQREIAAHRVHPGVTAAVGPALLHASAEAGVLVTEFRRGELVAESTAEWEPETYIRAGQLLAQIHSATGNSDTYFAEQRAKALEFVDRATALVPSLELDRVRDELRAMRPVVVPLVFTHGDYQPRNWIFDGGILSVIDFGRATDRHWTSDLVRLQHQQFVGHPELEEAFFAGLGRHVEPQDGAILRLENLMQAVTTVVWAHGIGDSRFEDAGRTMITRILNG